MKRAGVSVTTAYPGVVATHIRHRGFNAAGEAAGSSGLREDDAMSVEECARLILQGMEAPPPRGRHDGQGRAWAAASS